MYFFLSGVGLSVIRDREIFLPWWWESYQRGKKSLLEGVGVLPEKVCLPEVYKSYQSHRNRKGFS